LEKRESLKENPKREMENPSLLEKGQKGDREVTPQSLRQWLQSRVVEIGKGEFPHYRKLEGVVEGAERIKRAIETGEKITIVGDYDVDGVVGVALFEHFFRGIGYPVELIIPNRFRDGYGLNREIVERVGEGLIVTVDNGIGAVEGAERARELGIDLIITDHHTPPENLPPAEVIINPHLSPDFPFPEIAGAVVGWYLLGAVKDKLGSDFPMAPLLEFLALATIADMMPLQHLNRAIVRWGLGRINRSPAFPWSQFLRYRFRGGLDSSGVAFQVAPRLNSAGRLGVEEVALRFLTSPTFQDAKQEWENLEELNRKRRELEQTGVQRGEALLTLDSPVIAVEGEFHQGVVGIVAGKLAEKYQKPVLICTQEGEFLKGSGRSVPGIDLYQLLEEEKELFEKFGGHKMACGFTITPENFAKLKERLQTRTLSPNSSDETLPLVGELPLEELANFAPQWIEVIEEFEPYGEGFPRPIFKASGKVTSIQPLRGGHLKLVVESGNFYYPLLYFSPSIIPKVGEKIEFFYTYYPGSPFPKVIVEKVKEK